MRWCMSLMGYPKTPGPIKVKVCTKLADKPRSKIALLPSIVLIIININYLLLTTMEFKSIEFVQL